TKSTMVVFVGPFAALLIPYLLFRLPDMRGRLRLLAVLAVAFVAINGAHVVRNYRLYGSPMGSDQATPLLRNRTLTVSGTASNIIRNLTLYTATGNLTVTRAFDQALLFAHRFTGRPLNDPDLVL